MIKYLIVCAVVLMSSVMVYADFDLGDLPACNYPTFFGNPGHSMTDKAWLGECITQDDDPHPVNGDACDDGVFFVGMPWMPCEIETVLVTVTAGPNYATNPLWLNAWKDGNLDGDFCDTLCDGLADEWIIHNVPVVPGVHMFTFLDPGVTNIGRYAAVLRFRLSGRSLGRNAFGFYNPFDCPDSPFCGNFAADSLGEVEDYWLEDMQLDVALNSFDVLPGDGRATVNWSTASETDNDHFEILRDNMLVHQVDALGSSASGSNYLWVENGLTNGTEYHYTLRAVDVNGGVQELGVESVTPSANAVISEYALHQNYPNPFNPETQISYDLVASGFVSIKVYNMIGQEVATLVSGLKDAGSHTVTFDASHLPAALYLYKMDVNGYSATQKMLLIK